MSKSSEFGQTPFSPCSFDYHPGTPDNRRSLHSTSFAFRGPNRPLPREPKFDFNYGPDNLDSDTDEHSDGFEYEEQQALGKNLQFNASKQSLNAKTNFLRTNKGRPSESRKEPHWKKLTAAEKLSKIVRKFPYVHALAFFMCFPFGIIFAVESHFSFDKFMITLQEVMHMSYYGLETVEVLSTAFGCLIASLSALVFLASIISAYHGIKSDGNSIASSTPPLILIIMMYPAAPIWCFLLAGSLAATIGSFILQGVCDTEEIAQIWNRPDISTSDSNCILVSDTHSSSHCIECIDLYAYHFLFPSGARREDMELCGREVWQLCSKYLPDISEGTQMCTISAVFVLLGTALHLLALAHNRAELNERQKLRELRDLATFTKILKNMLNDTQGFDNSLV